MRQLTFLVAALLALPATAEDFSWIANVVAATMSEREALDVLTAQDLQTVIELETERQVMGCDTSSCLAEIAGAMDANVVVYGSLDALGKDNLLLQLNVFDAEAARAVGRKIVRAKDAAELSPKVEVAARELASSVDVKGGTVRLLVLDISTGAQKEQTEEEPPAPELDDGGLNVALIGGVSAVALGAIALGVGVTFDVISVQQHAAADESTLSAAAAAEGYEASDASALIAGVSYIVGAALVAAGVGTVVIGGLD